MLIFSINTQLILTSKAHTRFLQLSCPFIFLTCYPVNSLSTIITHISFKTLQYLCTILVFVQVYATILPNHVQIQKCSHSDTLTGKHQKQISHNKTLLLKGKNKKYIFFLHKHTVLIIYKKKQTQDFVHSHQTQDASSKNTGICIHSVHISFSYIWKFQ